jgi:hypothetical protein
MRKFILMMLWMICLSSTHVYGDGCGDNWYIDDEFYEPDNGQIYPFREGWELQVRGAGFYAIIDRFRDIYGDVGGEIQLEAAKMVNRNWGFWVNCSYYPNTGHSIGLHSFTRISYIPIGFGIKWLYSLTDRMDFYLGAGVTYSLLDIEDNSGSSLTHIHTWDAGALVKSGFRYDLSNRFFVDVFCDYLFQQYDFTTTTCGIQRLNTNAGGVTFGVGIGFKI